MEENETRKQVLKAYTKSRDFLRKMEIPSNSFHTLNIL